MHGDKIIYNGKLCELSEANIDINNLLSSNYVYQQIHVLDYRALHLPQHLQIAGEALTALFGDYPRTNRILSMMDQSLLQTQIELLLKANTYSANSCAVRLYASSDYYMICCHKQLLYSGYTFWHSRPQAIVVPYENPFSGYPTACSLISADFAADYAVRTQTNVVAITENFDHILVGVGDDPLFAVKGDTVMITPLNYGATQSVERREGMRAISKAGCKLIEEPLFRNDIPHYEELFTINTQGVVSIFSCNETTFFSLTAERIAKTYCTGQDLCK